MQWTFSQPDFTLIPQGLHTAIIHNAVETTSRKRQLPMINVTLRIDNSFTNYFLVFDSSSPQSTSRSNFYYAKFCKAFNITINDFNLQNWIGHSGSVIIEHYTDNNGFTKDRVASVASQPQSNNNSRNWNPQPYSPDQNIPF